MIDEVTAGEVLRFYDANFELAFGFNVLMTSTASRRCDGDFQLSSTWRN